MVSEWGGRPGYREQEEWERGEKRRWKRKESKRGMDDTHTHKQKHTRNIHKLIKK